jgi:arabinofuranosyltransferase
MADDAAVDTPSFDECGASMSAIAHPLARLPAWVTASTIEKALWCVPILVLIVLAYRFRWTFDDGFIYFRSVDQILAGNGPVFNAGERVESFTSPLWLATLTLGDVVSPFRLEYTALWLSIGCTVFGVALATVAAARLSRRDQERGIRVPLGLLVLVAIWPTWVWATSGMEVGLTYLWIGACFFVLAKWATEDSATPARPGWPVMLLLGLGWLVRPELILASALFVGVVVTVPALRGRQRVHSVLVAAAVPVLYQIFRMGYYGVIVATPAIAKEGSRLRPGYGWSYLTNFVGPYLLVVPLLALVFAVGGPMVRNLLAQKENCVLAVMAVVSGSGVAIGGYVVLVGGDYVHARLLMPALFAFLAPLFVVAATTRYLEGIVVTVAWSLLCGLALRADEQSSSFTLGHFGRDLTTEDRGFAQRGLDQPWIDGPGLYLGSTFTADGSATGIALGEADNLVVATRAIGAMGYALGPDAHIVDLHGLSDPLTAHQRLEFRSLPGHEKLAAAPWLVAALANEPGEVASNQLAIGADLWPEPEPLDFLDQVAWAQAALQCKPIDRFRDASTEPLTATRFVSNLWWSVPNTALRLDRDPRRAFDEHCRDGIPAAVAAFHRGATLASQLPQDPTSKELVVIDDCAAVFLRADDPDAEWQAVDGATFAATVRLDAADRVPRLAPLWVFSPIGTSKAVVVAETDGHGNYRIRFDIDWFLPIMQTWTRIPQGGEVRVALTPDIASQKWGLTVEWFKLSDLTMLSVDEGRTEAIMPAISEPDAAVGTISVDYAQPETSETCQSILEHAR